MARWLLLTWDGAGNQTPMTALAQALAARGDAVTVAGYGHQRDRFAAFAFRTLPRAAARYPAAPPPEGWMAVLPETVWACADHVSDLDDLLAEAAYDGVVADCLMFGALAALETRATPCTVLVHSAPGALAPPGGEMDALLLPAVNAVRAGLGRPPLAALRDAWAPFRVACTSVPELDPLPAPPGYAYVGPLTPARSPSGRRSPWPDADPRPLVLASFSTGPAWDQTSRIQRTLDALAGRPYRVLATTALATGLRVPANANAPAWLPHTEVLPHAAATVTHAGHGTVAASLAHGVPLVCLPNPAADQPALARRVAGLGAGVALDGETATAEEIAEAVRTVTEDPSYAKAAGAVAERIAAAPGVAGAVSLLPA